MIPSAPAAAALVRREQARCAAERAEETRLRERVVGLLRTELRAGERAWLIGSLAWGGFGAGSDVDVVLSGVDDRRSLELELLLAREANAPVDLLRLEHLPPAFKHRIEEQGLAVP